MLLSPQPLFHRDLDSRQRRFQRDVVRRDARDGEEIHDLPAELGTEEVVWRPLAKSLPCVGVDVRHHQRHLFLSEAVERRWFRVCTALRKHEADEFVVAFHMRFLVRGVGFAVEHESEPAVFVELDRGRVGELAAVVRDDHGEETGEHFAPFVAVVFFQHVPDGLERAQNTFAGFRVDEESKHEVERIEDGREQDLPALDAFHRVHFHDAHAGIGFHEREAVLPRPADAAGLVTLCSMPLPLRGPGMHALGSSPRFVESSPPLM